MFITHIHTYIHTYIHTNLYSANNRENESESLIRCMSSLHFTKYSDGSLGVVGRQINTHVKKISRFLVPKSIQIAWYFTELFKKTKSGRFCNALQYTLLCCSKIFCDYLKKYHKVAQIVAILSSNCAECREPADRDHRECCRRCCPCRRRYCHRSHRLQVSQVIHIRRTLSIINDTVCLSVST